MADYPSILVLDMHTGGEPVRVIRGGYPPVVVRPEDRLAYLQALQRDQTGQEDTDFRRLLYERLDASLSDYLSALRQAAPSSAGSSR